MVNTTNMISLLVTRFIKISFLLHNKLFCLKICKGLVKLCRSISIMYGQAIAAESQIIACALFKVNLDLDVLVSANSKA